jgi:branched-chain amino acid transport system substrate-binding protein
MGKQMSNARLLGFGLASLLVMSHNAHAAGGTIEIGLLADLSGPSALSDSHTVNGAQLAVDQINARGGIHGQMLKLVIEDDRDQNQAGVSAYEKLASDPNIVAIVSSVRSTIVQATLPYVLRDQIPTLIGGTDPKLTHIGNPWVFRFRPNDTYASQAMVAYSTGEMGGKKVAILYDTDAFGTAGKNLLVAALKKDNVPVLTEQGYTTATQDYTSYLENIKGSGADTLETYMTNAEDEAQMLKQLRQLGLNIKIMGSPSIATAVDIQLAGNAVNGTYGVSDFVASGTPESKAFSSAYEAKYHSAPDLFGAWVYDAVTVLGQVMAANGTSPSAIQKGMHAVQNYHGVEGTYSFDQNGDGLHGYWVVQLQNKTAEPIKFVDFSSS